MKKFLNNDLISQLLIYFLGLFLGYVLTLLFICCFLYKG